MNTRTRSALDRMAAQRFPSDQLVGDHYDSAPPGPHNALHGVSTQPTVEPPISRSSRRRVLVVAGVAAVAAVGSAVAVPNLTRSTAYAATPPTLHYAAAAPKETAVDVLSDLATRAQGQPPPPGSGRYHYIHTRGWYLHTEMTTSMRVLSSSIQPSEREQWIAPDGSGRLAVTRGGSPTSVTGTYPPGGLTAGFITADTAADIRAELTARNPNRTTAGWFQTVKDLWNRQVIPPTMQSALLNSLAARHDVRLQGTTTDRAGRRGIAVSTQAPSKHAGTPDMRYVLILDPQTGMLLDYEEIAMNAGALPIHAPATTGYTLWLSSGYSTTITEHP